MATTKSTSKIEVTFEKDRETKRTWRYTEPTEENPMNIYIRKADLEKIGSPDKIKLVITAA